MNFSLDTRKAIEATATLLRLVPGRRMDRKRLLALLYLADRESMARNSRPIIGGALVAMDHGPIHSGVYDLIKGSHPDELLWSQHFENEAFRIRLANDLRASALSRHEINLLNEISDRHAAMGTWDVAEATHLPEWKKNYREKTSTPIRLEDLLDAIGKTESKASIFRAAEEKDFFDKLFAGKK